MAPPFPPGKKKSNYARRGFKQPKHRINERIRVPEVRVIGPTGKQIGIIETKEAIRLAKENQLDLVELSATARPPVCRILDYGKFLYEESKKTKGQKTNTQKQKEVKFRLNIDTHDYETKLRRGESFLCKGHKLKVTLMLRGRELQHKDLAFEQIKRAIKDLSTVATADAPPKLVGRNITLTLTPLPEKKRQPKFIRAGEEFDEEDDDSELNED